MQASLLLPTLIHILTLCRPPYHEAPETPPRRVRAGHPVATEKRVKPDVPEFLRRLVATMPHRNFARHDGRNSESPPLPPENGLTLRGTYTAPTAQHVAAPTQPHRFRTTTDAPHHRPPTAQRYRARLRDARRKRIAAKRAATLPHDANAPGSSWIRGRSSCAAAAITCGTPSRSRRWRSRPVPPRCGAAGCTWPYGPNATWSRS